VVLRVSRRQLLLLVVLASGLVAVLVVRGRELSDPGHAVALRESSHGPNRCYAAHLRDLRASAR
jgi:hypothetical protein